MVAMSFMHKATQCECSYYGYIQLQNPGLRLPSVLPDQLYKPATSKRFLLDAILGPDDAFQVLDALIANRDDEPAILSELSYEGLRYMRGTCGDNDPVIGCILGQAHSAVAKADMDIEVTQIIQGLSGTGRQCAYALDGIYRRTEARENCSLVPRARADLKYPFCRLRIDSLGHECNHVGLGYSLTIADGQRIVIICLVFEIFLHKLMPRYLQKGIQHTLVLYAASYKLYVNHVLFCNQGIFHESTTTTSFDFIASIRRNYTGTRLIDQGNITF
jgi:hypothetical protein